MWVWGISISVDDCAIIFVMLGNKIDEWLEISATTTSYFYVFRSFVERCNVAKCGVELYDINLLYAVFEEIINRGIEILQIFFLYASADVYADYHFGSEIVATAHSIESRATIRTHTGEFSCLR